VPLRTKPLRALRELVGARGLVERDEDLRHAL